MFWDIGNCSHIFFVWEAGWFSPGAAFSLIFHSLCADDTFIPARSSTSSSSSTTAQAGDIGSFAHFGMQLIPKENNRCLKSTLTGCVTLDYGHDDAGGG